MKSPALDSVNAIRVIGEYMVFRLHILRFSIGMDMFARELMSFFVVLSGFSMMHRYFDLNFSTRKEAKVFAWNKWWTVFPFYLFGWACSLAKVENTASSDQPYCLWSILCTVLQFFMLDCWAGCSVRHTGNSLLWLISCLWWIWLGFLLLKETIISFFYTRVWLKMSVIGALSTAIIIPFSDYDVSVISSFPLLRAGEFIIGCGVACALRQRKSINDMVGRWYWCPLILSLGGMILIYSVLGSPHGVISLCLQRDLYTNLCTLWGKSSQIDKYGPPCYTTGDIFFNKNAMPWGVVVYCVAQAEVDGNSGAIMQLLRHDFFKFLHRFSLTLYLCHPALAYTVKWVASGLVGWSPVEWQPDTLLITTYGAAYLIHSGIRHGVSTLNQKYTNSEQSSSMPLIPVSDPILEFDNNVSDDTLHTTMVPTEQCLESTNPGEY